MSFIRHHRIQCSLTMFKKSHYHVVKLNETEPKSVFWFFMRLSGDVTRMSEWKGLPKTFRKVEFCCAIYKSLALIDFGSVFVSKVRPKCENLGSSGLVVKQAWLQYFLLTVKPLSYPRKVFIASTKNFSIGHSFIPAFSKSLARATSAKELTQTNIGQLILEIWQTSPKIGTYQSCLHIRSFQSGF